VHEVVIVIDRLSADDRLLQQSDKAWPQDVGLILILDGGPLLDVDGRLRIDVARDAVARALPGLPRLRQVLRIPPRGLGGPFWADAPSFDLAHHVHAGPRLQIGDDAGLLGAVEQIRSHRLDPTLPLWEIWLLPGFDAGRVGMFVRMHHVVADGVAGIASLATLLRSPSEDDVRAEPGWIPAPEPSRRDLLSDSLRRHAHAIGGGISTIRHPRAGLRTVADVRRATRQLVGGEPGPVSSLAGLVGPHRRLALVRTSLGQVQAVARASGATVNDVLLAMTAGGVRALLISRGEPVSQLTFPILVPVSLRRTADRRLGNRISQMRIQLPVGEPDPGERLRRVTAGTAKAKAITHPPMGMVFRNRLLSAIMLRFIIRQRINLLSADIVGPTQPLSFAGATVQDAFPLINLMGNVTLGVGAFSYPGRFDVLAVADADLYPDLDIFAAAAAAEIRLLSTLSPHQHPLPSTQAQPVTI